MIIVDLSIPSMILTTTVATTTSTTADSAQVVRRYRFLNTPSRATSSYKYLFETNGLLIRKNAEKDANAATAAENDADAATAAENDAGGIIVRVRLNNSCRNHASVAATISQEVSPSSNTRLNPVYLNTTSSSLKRCFVATVGPKSPLFDGRFYEVVVGTVKELYAVVDGERSDGDGDRSLGDGDGDEFCSGCRMTRHSRDPSTSFSLPPLDSSSSSASTDLLILYPFLFYRSSRFPRYLGPKSGSKMKCLWRGPDMGDYVESWICRLKMIYSSYLAINCANDLRSGRLNKNMERILIGIIIPVQVPAKNIKKNYLG